MSKIAKLFLTVLLFFIFFPLFQKVDAADFVTTYKVEYHLKESGNRINSTANFRISITNTRSDVYVNKFAISFPKSFTITNLKVSDDRGDVKPNIQADDTFNKIEMEFNNPNIGRGSVNNFNLTFDQANLFKVNGNVWEVILPVIENRGDASYDVTVFMPENSKKISIAKPRPTEINGREIKWSNPTTRTIYAVFGESQLYEVNLAYNLKNNGLTSMNTEVAFPPDTLYQKISIQSISQQPTRTYQDEDGNYMAVYNLKPKETKTVNVNFLVEVFTEPREEVIPQIRAAFQNQKSYLLNSQKYWEIESLDKIAGLKTKEDVYYYVTKSLKYSYERVNAESVRMGAEKILKTPNIAVCMEFTDLFVGIAREKGIYAREIEGYGSSSDPQLRPLSLSSDILHAWPEYYDEEAGLWKPVDPTWENTSGIDYYSSFDLNHIVFAIHGKRSEYPLPAGMYKVENSKDIEVTAVTGRPQEREEIGVTDIAIPTRINDNKSYKGAFSIKNSGNVYSWNIPVKIIAKGLSVTNSKTNIISLAPGEKKEIVFEYRTIGKVKTNENSIKVTLSDHDLFSRQITVSSFGTDLMIMIIGGSVVLTVLFLVIRKLRA
jgi:transglutaminase-like putative cysteine protease